MEQEVDERSAAGIDPEFLADGPDTEYKDGVEPGEAPPPSNQLSPEQLAEAVKKNEERERVLKELGDHFLVLIPDGVKGVDFYMTRVSIDENGAPTVGRATIIAVLEKIVRDIKVMEEMDLQKQIVAKMVDDEKNRQQSQKATSRILVPR